MGREAVQGSWHTRTHNPGTQDLVTFGVLEMQKMMKRVRIRSGFESEKAVNAP